MAAPGPLARPLLASTRAIKMVSYNILAPRYAGYNSYCPPQFLDWTYRKQLVLRELDHHAADVVALQECDKAFFETDLAAWMAARGVEGAFLPRNVGPVPGPLEGIALLWRAAALEAVATRSAEYGGMGPEVAGLPCDAAGTEPWAKLQQLGEGVVMAALRHRATGQVVVAASTHLFWNPSFPDVKTLQAALLCGSLAAFAREHAGAASAALPVMLGGDFNSLASKRLPDKFDPQLPPGGLVSGVYTLLSSGTLQPDHPDHPATRVWEGGQGASGAPPRFPSVPLTACGLRLTSLSVEAFGREPPVTNRTAAWAGCLDYVWLSQDCLQVASAIAMPYSDGEMPPLGPQAEQPPRSPGGSGPPAEPTWVDPVADIDMVAIPDARYPSDHLAVGGVVLLLPA